MKVLKYIICAAAIVIGLASCSITRHNAYTPSATQLNLQMADLEYLGEVEISVEYRRYLGVITSIDKINGEKYDGKKITNFPIFGNKMANTLLPKLKRASYQVLKEYPTADYFIVTNQTREKDQLFLGSHITAKAKIKAYTLK